MKTAVFVFLSIIFLFSCEPPKVTFHANYPEICIVKKYNSLIDINVVKVIYNQLDEDGKSEKVMTEEYPLKLNFLFSSNSLVLTIKHEEFEPEIYPLKYSSSIKFDNYSSFSYSNKNMKVNLKIIDDEVKIVEIHQKGSITQYIL